MNEDRFLSLIGLAQKAGKLVSGELAVEKAVRAGKAKAVIIAQDSSESTKKNYRDITAYYKVVLYEGLTKQQLGLAIGKAGRAAIAITDAGFCKSIIKEFTE